MRIGVWCVAAPGVLSAPWARGSEEVATEFAVDSLKTSVTTDHIHAITMAADQTVPQDRDSTMSSVSAHGAVALMTESFVFTGPITVMQVIRDSE